MKRTLSLPCISEVVKRIHVMLMLLTSKTFACMHVALPDKQMV